MHMKIGRQQGYVLLSAAAAAVLIMGMVGLCLDLARMYVAKNELQNYSDAASIAATNRLDGTVAGVTNAITEATTNGNKWGFAQNAVSSVTVDFATAKAGPWLSNPSPATGYRFTRVRGQGNVKLYFLPILPGLGTSRTVAATAVAGQTYLGELGDGAFPFSPDAHVPNPLPADPSGNFGYIKGEVYTMRWDPVGKGSKVGITNRSGNKMIGCAGDMNAAGFIPGADNSGQRGYLDLQQGGGGSGAAFIREAILGKIDVDPIDVGDLINNANGNKQTEVDTILERLAQDTNPTTPTYYTAKAAGVGLEPPGRTYYAIDPPGVTPPSPPRGNGRRIVTVPVNNPPNDLVVGFAMFFLPKDPCLTIGGSGNPKPCCAEYVGSAARLPASGGVGNGSGSLGAYRIKLFY
jgi:Flp pilus assembly protein TadG